MWELLVSAACAGILPLYVLFQGLIVFIFIYRRISLTIGLYFFSLWLSGLSGKFAVMDVLEVWLLQVSRVIVYFSERSFASYSLLYRDTFYYGVRSWYYGFLSIFYASDYAALSAVASMRYAMCCFQISLPWLIVWSEYRVIGKYMSFRRFIWERVIKGEALNIDRPSLSWLPILSGMIVVDVSYPARYILPYPLNYLPLFLAILGMFKTIIVQAVALSMFCWLGFMFVAAWGETEGWCYLKTTVLKKEILEHANFQSLIGAEELVTFMRLNSTRLAPFKLVRFGNYLHVTSVLARDFDLDLCFTTLLENANYFVGHMSWRMRRKDANPLAKLHARITNTIEGVIRSKGLTPIAGLVARSTEFNYESPLTKRISPLNRVQELAVLNNMRARNDISVEDAKGLQVQTQYLKTSIPLHGKAAKMIEERTGVVLVSDPEVAGPHEEAALLRAKFLVDVANQEKNLGVGMVIIAPSVLEMHLFPLSVWIFIDGADGFDADRVDGGCGCGEGEVCKVRAAAAADGRWLVEKEWTSRECRRVLMKYGVSRGLMVHVEPNVKPKDILRFMQLTGVTRIYSLMNFSIMPVFGLNSVDGVTKHTFVVHGKQVVCGFDSGTYSHRVEDFQDICRVVENGKGQWLKREIMFEVERTVACVLHISVATTAGVAIAYRPSLHNYYVIPSVSGSGLTYLLVKRNAMDNLLQRLSTKEKISSEEIFQAIRGSSVQLTIAGATVTPRFEQSWDESRALVNFVYIYLNASKVFEKVTKVSAVLLDRESSWLDRLSAYTTGFMEMVKEQYGAKPIDVSFEDLRSLLSLMLEKSRHVSLHRLSELCMVRIFGVATMKVKRSEVGQRHTSLAQLRDEYMHAHTADLSSTMDLTLRISKRWLAENISLVADGASVAGSAWVGLWSIAEEAFRKRGDMPNAERSKRLRLTYDWTKYCGPEVVRALLECVVGDSLTFLSAAKHLISTVVQSYSEAANQTVIQAEIVATADTIERFRTAAAEAEIVNDQLCLLWFNELYQLYEDVMPQAAELFHANFFPLGNDRAAMLRSFDQVLDAFFIMRRQKLGERVIPYQDVFHSIVTVFGSIRGVTNRASLLDTVIQKVVAEAGQGMEPVLKDLARAVERKAAEVLEKRSEEIRKFDSGEKLMENTNGDLLETKVVEVDIVDSEGKLLDLEQLDRQGRVVTFRGRDTNVSVRRVAGKGKLSDEEMEEIAKEEIAWSVGAGVCSRDRTNHFVPSRRIGAKIFDQLEADVRNLRDSNIADLYDENAFDVEMEAFVHNPEFGELAEQVNHFTQYQTQPSSNYLAHFRGLPASAKSAFMRQFLDHRDLVIAPSKKLKLEWEKELSDMPRDKRPRVLTQHVALLAAAERYVVVDEVYTLGRQQVAAYSKIARCGLITLGDPSQIRVAFQGGALFDFEHMARYRFQSVLSFIPFDALCVYLANADLALYDLSKPFISVSSPIRGLRYVVTTEPILNGDLHITMEEGGAAMRRQKGQLNCRTAHKLQGSRAKMAVVYLDAMETVAFSRSLMHFGVAISRSTEQTILAIQRGVAYAGLPGIRVTAVNGGAWKSYSNFDCTSYLDFCRVEEEGVDVEEEVREKQLLLERFKEQFFPEAVKPATFVVDEVSITKDDFLQETVASYPVDEFISKIGDLSFRDCKWKLTDSVETILKGGVLSALHNFLPRAKRPEIIKKEHRVAATKLLTRHFEETETASRQKFVEMFQLALQIHYYDQKRPQQLKTYLQADGYAKAHMMASSFPKNAIAKKTAFGKLKFQGVTSSNATIQALFAQYVFALTFAFKHSLRKGIYIDVGYDDEELFGIIAHLQSQLKGNKAFLVDQELQDSTHSAYDIATFSELLRLGGVSRDIRNAFEHVRAGEKTVDIKGEFVMKSATALTSGAPWTLISNIIELFMTVHNAFEIPKDAQFLQKGDDLSSTKKFHRRVLSKIYPDDHVRWTLSESRYLDFTSKACIQGARIRKNMRLFINCAFEARTEEKHRAWQLEMNNFYNEAEEYGVDTWMQLRYEIFGVDPTGAWDIVGLAWHLSNLEWKDLPRELKLGGIVKLDKTVLISEKKNCVYHAFSFVVAAENQGIIRDNLLWNDISWDTIRKTAEICKVDVKFERGCYPGDGQVRCEKTGQVRVWEDHAVVFLTAEEKRKVLETKDELRMRERIERID